MEIVLFLMGVAVLYCLPTILAFTNNNKKRYSIMLLNLFFGWSLVGWAIALIWAVNND
jgi:hypothetical protein